MRSLRKIRFALWAVVGMAVVVGGLLAWWETADAGHQAEAGRSMTDGAGWRLLDEGGRLFLPAELRGRPTVLVFGFTRCPDVCPTALSYLASVLQSLGRQGDAIQPLFLTVDPERDTAAVVAEYTDLFDPRIRGVTGAPDQMAAALKGFGVYFRKVPQEGGYSMDHSATILLLDSQARLRSTLDVHEEAAVAAQKVGRLLAAEGAAEGAAR